METARKKSCFVALLLCLLLALSAVSLPGCATTSSGNKGTIKIGVRTDITGFSSYNSVANKYYGFEIDLAQEMANRLGYSSVEWVAVTPDDRKEKLQNGEVDALVACYSVSESREKNFDFSPSYYSDSILFMTEKSSRLSSLEGHDKLVFGTLSGANTAPQLASYMAEKGLSNGEVVSANDDNTNVTFDTWQLLQFDSYQEISDALEAGTIDIMASDGCIAKAYMKDCREIMRGIAIDPQICGRGAERLRTFRAGQKRNSGNA